MGVPTYNLKHTWVLSDRLVFDNGFNHTNGGFKLDFPDPARQENLQPLFNDVTDGWSRSFDRQIEGPRPVTEVKTDSSYFWSNLLGGDHQVKFGARYKMWKTGSGDQNGGDATAQFDDLDGESSTSCATAGRTTNCYGNSLSPELVRIFRDGNTLSKSWTYGAYIQDNYSRGRLRLNMGLRYDFQDGKTLGTCVPASTFAPEILPAFCWDGADGTAPFKDWAPRLAATYDLFGTGRTVLKGSYALFFDQGELITNLGGNQAGEVELRAPWNDANGDTFVQTEEVDFTRLTLQSGNFDLSTGQPRNVTSPNIVDANVWNGRTTEIIGTISHELFANFGLDLSYIYRKDDHDTFVHRIGETADMWVRREWIPTPAQADALPAGVGQIPFYYYEIAPGVVRPANVTHTQRSTEYAVYRGWEISARKRMSNRWQMNASFTWNDRRLYNVTGSGVANNQPDFDLTNANFVEGFNPQIRYLVKFSGAVQLPGGFTLAQNTNIQEGNNRVVTFNAPICRSGRHHDDGRDGSVPRRCDEPDGRPARRADGRNAPPGAGDDGPVAEQAVPARAGPIGLGRDHVVQPVQREHDPRILEQQPEQLDVHARLADCAAARVAGVCAFAVLGPTLQNAGGTRAGFSPPGPGLMPRTLAGSMAGPDFCDACHAPEPGGFQPPGFFPLMSRRRRGKARASARSGTRTPAAYPCSHARRPRRAPGLRRGVCRRVRRSARGRDGAVGPAARADAGARLEPVPRVGRVDC